MRLWRVSLLLLSMTAGWSQTPTEVITPEVRRVGSRLACLCGSCKNDVGSCAMLQCGYSFPARQKIARLLKAGYSDDQIVAEFVKERGRQALVVPPTEGFHLLAWLTPFAALAAGLALIWMFVRRFQSPQSARAPVAEIAPEAMDRYREQIEKETARLDG